MKGDFEEVIKDGVIIERTMRKNDLSKHNLLEDLRLNGNVDNPKKVCFTTY